MTLHECMHVDIVRDGSPLNRMAPTMKPATPTNSRAYAQKCEQLMAASFGLTNRAPVSPAAPAGAILILCCLRAAADAAVVVVVNPK